MKIFNSFCRCHWFPATIPILLPILSACVTIHPAPARTSPAAVQAFLAEHGASAENLFFSREELWNLLLPKVYLVDGKRRLYFSESGYQPGIGQRLSRAMAESRPGDEYRWENPLSPDGREVRWPDLPRAEFYLIEHWATWCEPCAVLLQELEDFVSSQPPGRVLLLKISHDPF